MASVSFSLSHLSLFSLMLLLWEKPFHEKSYGEAHMSRYQNFLLLAI